SPAAARATKRGRCAPPRRKRRSRGRRRRSRLEPPTAGLRAPEAESFLTLVEQRRPPVWIGESGQDRELGREGQMVSLPGSGGIRSPGRRAAAARPAAATEFRGTTK